MPKNGDIFTVPIGEAQLKWGTFRKPTNRNPVDGESYFAIPREMAVKYGIFQTIHKQVLAIMSFTLLQEMVLSITKYCSLKAAAKPVILMRKTLQ